MAIIYKVTNLINNKVYIGLTRRSLETRKKEHLRKLKTENSYFHRAIVKHGINNFKWEIIEECEDNIVNDKECYWINYYNSYLDKTKGYNETPGGEGYRLSEETKQKISKANKGKKRTEAQKQHLSEVREKINFHHSEEAKQKMSENRKGKKLNISEEERKRRSEWMSSKDFRNKVKDSRSYYFTEEHKKHISEAQEAQINLFTSKDENFHSWREIYDFLIKNQLTQANSIAVIRNNINQAVNTFNKKRYERFWKMGKPFTEKEKEQVLLTNTYSRNSKETKQKISNANKKKNEIVIGVFPNNETINFYSRTEAYNYCIDNNYISETTKYSRFSSKIMEAYKTQHRYKKIYWTIIQKDVETIESMIQM